MPDMLFTKITSLKKNLLKLNLRPAYNYSSTFMIVNPFRFIQEPCRSNFRKCGQPRNIRCNARHAFY